MACRMAGMVGCGGGPPLFFPPCCFEAAGLKEGVGNHCHLGVSVQADPRSTLEVVEAEFFLELLMRLLTDPSGFDRGGDRLPLPSCPPPTHGSKKPRLLPEHWLTATMSTGSKAVLRSLRDSERPVDLAANFEPVGFEIDGYPPDGRARRRRRSE